MPFLLLALVTLAWGGRARWEAGALARYGEVVQGRVIDVRYVPGNPAVARQSSRRGQARGESPVVSYTTRAGEPRTLIGSVNRYPVPWKAGDAIEVVYDPANPQHADVRAEVTGWVLWFVIWCTLAALLMAIASLPIILRLRERRE